MTTPTDFLDKDTLAGLDIESILELDISQIQDLEEYIPKPTGRYAFQVEGFEMDTIGTDEKAAVKVQFKLLEVIELANDEEANEVGELPAVHTETFVMEKTKGGYGVRKFVTMFRAIAVAAGVTQVKDILEAAMGATGAVIIKREAYTNKETGVTRVNANIEAYSVEWA